MKDLERLKKASLSYDDFCQHIERLKKEFENLERELSDKRKRAGLSEDEIQRKLKRKRAISSWLFWHVFKP